MSSIAKSLLWLTSLSLFALCVLGLAVALDLRPRVERPPTPTTAERAWADTWLRQQRQRHSRALAGQRLELTPSQVNLLLNTLLDRTGQGQALVQLETGRARLVASLKLPLDQLDGYLNLELELIEAETLPRVSAARLAGLPLPGSLAQALIEQALQALDRTQMVRAVGFTPERLTLQYDWHPEMLDRLSGGMIAADTLPLVLAAQEALVRYAAAQPRRQPLRLAEVLTHLLRTMPTEHAEPLAQHRAVILAVAAYVNGQSIRDPADVSTAPRPTLRRVHLRGRADLSQHFMTSAALAIQSTDALSNLVGWYKELADANGGSGFSFADMTANRAGIRFARLATENLTNAQYLQSAAQAGLTEADLMPPVDQLPEGLSQAQFDVQLGSDQRREYQRLIEQIDRTIEALPLYRQRGNP